MNNKIKKTCLLLTAAFSCALAVVMTTKNFPILSFGDAVLDDEYGIKLIPFNESDNVDSLTTSSGNLINFYYSGYSQHLDSFGILSASGELFNQTPISGMSSISILCSSEEQIELELSYGWNYEKYVVSQIFNSTTIIYTFNNESPTFFKVKNISESPITITSIQIKYSCLRTDIPDIYDDDKLIFSPSTMGAGYCVSGFKEGIVDIEIPSSYLGQPVLYISNNAFANCSTLRSVVIPEGISLIGDYAFSNCTSLETIFISSSVEQINTHAFSDCYYLDNVFYGGTENQWNNIEVANEDVFDNYIISHASPIFNISVEEMAIISTEKFSYVLINNKFVYCFKMCDLTITTFDFDKELPDLIVVTLSKSAFSQCTLLESISIPNSVIAIGKEAFRNCTSLKTLDLPDELSIISEKLFRGCTSLESVSIPQGVVSIGSNAFANCSSITYINIPNSVKIFYDEAFRDCSSLLSINIPNSVTTIEEEAFRFCTSLTSIIIPDSVITMDKEIFRGCTGITVYCQVESKPDEWNENWSYGFDGEIVWGYKG